MATYDLAGKRVWVAGHRGLAGSALLRRLRHHPFGEIITVGREDLDLRDGARVSDWMERTRPQAIFLAAAKVGGIHANNSLPADFISDNLMIQTNVIRASHAFKVEKLLFLGSSCVYPRLADQPIKEAALLTGPLEPTNEWYAVAKIAGIKLCQAFRKQHGCDFISAMPCSLYGPNDNFHLETGHVLPSLLRRFHEASTADISSVTLWGTGIARREFMHADDHADALIFLMQNYSEMEHINVGPGYDVTIRELATIIKNATGYRGRIEFDCTRPDGTPRKLMDVSRLAALGWTPRISLEQGIRDTFRWYLDNSASLRELPLAPAQPNAVEFAG